MPRQNRVTPYGELITVPDRGMFLGFRGVLHDKQRNLVRYSSGKAWAICAVEFKGRRRPLWAPGRLTELFFLDEATGLAAGHRPCAECRYRDYKSLKLAWAATHPGVPASAAAIDDSLHADRLSAPGVRRTFTAALAGSRQLASLSSLRTRPWRSWRPATGRPAPECSRAPICRRERCR